MNKETEKIINKLADLPSCRVCGCSINKTWMVGGICMDCFKKEMNAIQGKDKRREAARKR